YARDRGLGRVDEVRIQTRPQRSRKLVTHQRLSGGAGITQQLLSHDSDVRDLQRLKGPTREVELGQRLGLTLTNPVTLTAGSLPHQGGAERHLTERGNTAGTEATEDGLRPQVLHEVRKGRSLLAN